MRRPHSQAAKERRRERQKELYQIIRDARDWLRKDPRGEIDRTEWLKPERPQPYHPLRDNPSPWMKGLLHGSR